MKSKNLPDHLRELYTKDKIRAVDAKFEAQKLAFAPYAFQAAKCLRDFQILQMLFEAGDQGMTAEEIGGKSGLSEYGIEVLLEMGLSLNVLKLKGVDDPPVFLLSKTGFFLIHDDLTRVNMDFMHDVCYNGGFFLKESIEKGRPEGLKTMGSWKTIYEGLSSLEKDVQKSWFAFDHFYSDAAFSEALRIVLGDKKKHLMDIGGNTARWALRCAEYDKELSVTIVDLPGQASMARKNIDDAGVADRVRVHEADMLDTGSELPEGCDAVWMSQFLDCFSMDEITSILKKVYNAVDGDAYVYVMEPLWDKQRYPAATYSLHATSLYFTNMANGNSKMYSMDEIVSGVEKAGFRLESDVHQIGPNDYSILCFKKTGS